MKTLRRFMPTNTCFYVFVGITTTLLVANYGTNITYSVIETNQQEVERITPGFLVHSAKCSIPDINPRHPTVVKFIKKEKKISCALAPPLTTMDGNDLLFHREHAGANIAAFMKGQKEEKREGSMVRLNESDPVSCSYRSVRRVSQPAEKYNSLCDKKFEFSEKSEAITEERTKIHFEGILVVCKANETVIYKNVHIIAQRNLLLLKRHRNLKYFNDSKSEDAGAAPTGSRETPSEVSRGHRQEEEDGDQKDDVRASYNRTNPLPVGERLNVIMFMTDAVSRLNFYRQMPQTTDLLGRLGAIDMAGYNKVGDNTYPNLVAILMGLTQDQLQNHTCRTRRKVKVFDDCPLVWKEFRRNGYVTGLMEDAPWMSTFNYNNPGFLVPPTEFYPRPFFQASEAEIAWKKKGNAKYCQGHKLSLRVVQEGCLSMAKSLPDIPFFGLFISSSVTHDYLNLAQNADGPHLKFLEELRDLEILKKTVLVFFSDHGQRWGKIRSTLVGMMEERLPFMFFLFPEWFQERYPEAYKNLKDNVRQLTSNFDVHTTLRDIAFGNYADLEYVTSVPTSSRGISLFRKIPKDRSCEEAGIPDHFCTCHGIVPLPLNETVAISGAEFLKDTLNRDLRSYTQCVQFTKIDLISAGTSQYADVLKPKDAATELKTYVLQGRLHPGGAEIEATLHQDPVTDEFELAGEISRINEYGSQSHCITHNVLRKYCYCWDMLHNG